MNDRDVLLKQLKLMAERIMIEGARMPSESMTIEYDNGGGQTGVRENPYYPAYEKLLTSYTRALDVVKNMAGDTDEVSGLDSIRAKFKVAK
jgi:hypothetical protein